MSNNRNENNTITVTGKVVGELECSHEFAGEKFYTAMIEVVRRSGTIDTLRLIISERLIAFDLREKYIRATGSIRTFDNKKKNSRENKLVVSVFVDSYDLVDSSNLPRVVGENDVYLNGTICRKPTYNITGTNREISVFILSVKWKENRQVAYIPCITWGRNAKYTSELDIGSQIELSGRLQSRNYYKILPDGNVEERTTYEVSVKFLGNVIEKEEAEVLEE
jgi:hypothetical protein